MSEHCAELKKLHAQIPIYGKGTLQELHQVFIQAKPLILTIIAQEEYNFFLQPLGISTVEIEELISWAGSAATKKEKEGYFIRASAQLGADIRTVMGLLGFR